MRSNNDVYKQFRAVFLEVQVNYAPTNVLPAFVITGLVQRYRYAHVIYAGKELPKELWLIVSGYAATHYSNDDMDKLMDSIPDVICHHEGSSKSGYVMDFDTTYRTSLHALADYFNTLMPGSSEIKESKHDSKRVKVAITNEVLFNHSFFSDLKESIAVNTDLVERYREITFCRSVVGDLRDLAGKFGQDLVFNVKEEVYSNITESGYSSRPYPTPYYVAINALCSYIRRQGLKDEKQLKNLIASIAKENENYMKIKGIIDEDHDPYAEPLSEMQRLCKAVCKFERYSQLVRQHLDTIETFMNNKFVKNIKVIPDEKALVCSLYY